jgi:hypothetical protein
MDRAFGALARPSGIEKALESFRSMDRAFGALARPSGVEKALESFRSHQLEIDKAIAAIDRLPAIEDMLYSFGKASSIMLGDLSSLSAIYESIEKADFSSSDPGHIEDDLTKSVDQLNKADSHSSYLSIFTSLPPLAQVILFFLLLNVFLPIINSISANLLTPMVEHYLQDNNLTNREKVKEIKAIPLYLNGVDTSGLRFITGNNVRLRAEPSTKSEILDELVLGQVVTILSKDRNWIEVMYKYDDGEVMSGWVFTRYTARFVK